MKYIFIAVLLMFSVFCYAKTVKVSSPDRKICLTLSDAGGRLSYRILYNGKTIVDESALELQLDWGNFGRESRLGKAEITASVDDYDLPVGKVAHVSARSNRMAVPVSDNGHVINLIVRAFDDAVAFRYEIPSQKGWEQFVIKDETMELRPSGNPEALAMYLPNFTSSHENTYTDKPVSELPEEGVMDMPVTFNYGRCYMSVTEANLVGYAGMYLKKKDGILLSCLSPRPDMEGISVLADLPHHTPWRVFMIGDRIGALIESTVLTTLSDPCKVDDTSWLKPGKTTFSWWNDTEVPDTTFQRGNNFMTNKYYVDFAARSGIQYHSIYGFADMPWYIDDGTDFGAPGPGADVTRPVGQLDMPGICKYAESQGVNIHVWLNWAAMYKDIDRVFDKFNEWGVKGMMVDFMDRDDQLMIEIQENILRKAAQHHLFIQFHGSSKPSGLVRTYPNEFTREGTLNYEVYKGDDDRRMGADHDINIPFTRLLAGATDYHLGGFRSLPMDKYVVRQSRPWVTSTRCHMLAMYIVLESYLSMVCDYPEAYRNQPGFDFLCKIPSNWDDISVPAAEFRKYVAIARKSGKDWYVGIINNSKERKIELPLGFLGMGKFSAQACYDAKDTDQDPNHIDERAFSVSSKDNIKIRLASGGGAVIRFSEEK